MRVQFEKAKQREFLQRVMQEIGCPSLKELSNRLDISYSSLKNYFVEARLLPEILFEDLLFLSKLSKENLKFELLDENWGKVKGGQVFKI